MIRTRSIVTWSVALAVFFAQSNLPAYLAHAQATQQAVDQEIARLELLHEALEEAAAAIPRDTFDAVAVLAQTDRTPVGAFAWVRDNTYLVPYRGALRGPVGVLMDRMGNSLDRALLLQELLVQLGYETRLARAELSPDSAQAVMSAAPALPATTLSGPIKVAESELDGLAARLGLEEDVLETKLDQSSQLQSALYDELTRRMDEQSAFLLTTLGSPRGDAVAERAVQQAALQDHWWVQFREGDVWTDLDPSAPDAVPGVTVAAPVETLTARDISELPEGLRHTVAIRVVLECAVAGALQEFVLVESPPLLPAAVLGQHLVINHVPVGMSQEPTSFDDPARLAAILEQDRWFPVLSIGAQQLYTNDFTSSCEIGDASPPWLGAAVGEGFQQAADVLGGLGEEPPPTESATRVTAQWLEYQIDVPGEPSSVVRRQIFDLLGAADRAAPLTDATSTPPDELSWRLALLGETEILVVGHHPSPAYVEAVTAKNTADNLRVLLDVLHDPETRANPTEAVGALAAHPHLLFSLASLRRELSVGDVFLASPNVLSYHRQQLLGPTGVPIAVESFDIVANAVAVAPQVEDPFSARLRQGVLDTNIEALVAGAACQLSVEMVCPRVINAGELVEEAARQGVAWRVLTSTDELAGVAAAPEVVAQWHQDLSDGYVVVIPERPVEVVSGAMIGWWRVDASSGEALGIGENGWGAALTEYLYLIRIGFTAFFAMACAVAVDTLPVSDSGKGVALVMCALAASLSFAGVLTSGTASLSGLIMGIMGDAMKVLATYLPDLYPPG